MNTRRFVPFACACALTACTPSFVGDWAMTEGSLIQDGRSFPLQQGDLSVAANLDVSLEFVYANSDSGTTPHVFDGRLDEREDGEFYLDLSGTIEYRFSGPVPAIAGFWCDSEPDMVSCEGQAVVDRTLAQYEFEFEPEE